MRKFTNPIATLPLLKWMSSEVVVTPIAFISILLVYLTTSSAFSA